MDSRRLPSLDLSLVRGNVKAPGRAVLAVPFQRVPTREEIPAPVAKGDLKWMRLHSVAMPLEIVPIAEARAGAESAFERGDGPACPIGRGRYEEGTVPITKPPREVEEVSVFRRHELAVIYAVYLLLLLHRAVSAVPHRCLCTPLNPRLSFLRNRSHRLLQETWPLQESMVNSLRIRRREPLRSASHSLGFTMEIYQGPSGRLLMGPIRRPSCFRDPEFCDHSSLAPLIWAYFVVVPPLRASVMDGVVCFMMSFAEDRPHVRGGRRRRIGDGHARPIQPIPH